MALWQSLRAQRGNPRLPDFLDCHVTTFLAMTVLRYRHCERSAAIHDCRTSWIATSLRASQ
jgi:hypothetical protein